MRIIVAKETTIIANNVSSIEIHAEKDICIFMNSQEEFVIDFDSKSNAEKCYKLLKEFFAVGNIGVCHLDRRTFDIEKQNGFLRIHTIY